jgi:hypothetical protein
VFSVAVLAALTCTTPKAEGLLGFWESKKTSKGGIGHTMEFRPDGVAVLSTTVIVDMFYRTSKGRLFVGEEADPTKQSDTGGFLLEGNALVLTATDGKVLKKTRLGVADKTPSIVGSWSYRHYTDAVAFELYTVDGRLLFRLPMTAYQGCYSAAEGKLITTAPKSATIPFDVRGDELVLRQEGKEPLAYGRVKGGAWYPRDVVVGESKSN